MYVIYEYMRVTFSVMNVMHSKVAVSRLSIHPTKYFAAPI